MAKKKQTKIMAPKVLLLLLGALVFSLPTSAAAQIKPPLSTNTDAETISLTPELIPLTATEMGSLLLGYISATSTQEQLSETLAPALLSGAHNGYELLVQADALLASDDLQKNRKAATLRRFAKVGYLAMLISIAEQEKTFVTQEISTRTQEIIASIQEPKPTPINVFHWLRNLF